MIRVEVSSTVNHDTNNFLSTTPSTSDANTMPLIIILALVTLATALSIAFVVLWFCSGASMGLKRYPQKGERATTMGIDKAPTQVGEATMEATKKVMAEGNMEATENEIICVRKL